MGKLITNKAVQILVVQAIIAVLIALAAKSSVFAAPYTVFGQDDPRGALTNSTAARAVFLASVFDDSTNSLDSLTAGGRNEIYAQSIGLGFTGQRARQYGLAFASGGTTIYGRSTRTSQTYAAGVGLGTTTSPLYDDIIYTSASNSFAGTPVSGGNLMGGDQASLGFEFATTTNTGNTTGVKAFGFYGIDAGDTATNNLSVTVTYLDATTQNFVIKPGGFATGAGNNNTFFFGLVTPDQAFTSVTINNPQNATDGVGYDDFTIGTSVSAAVIPEAPSLTGLLIGCSLLGVVMIKRRNK